MRKLSVLLLLLLIFSWTFPAFAQVDSSAPSLTHSASAASVKVKITSSAKINDGTTRQLKLKITPVGAYADIVWSVENDSQVVAVDETGLVTAQKPGSAYVRATDTVSGKYSRCKITVKKVNVSKVRLNLSSLTLFPNEVSTDLSATVLPANATVKTVTWSSSKPDIVSVDPQTGKLTAVGAGTAVITAKSSNKKKASCQVRAVGRHTTFTLSAVGDIVMGGDYRERSALNRITEQVFAQLLEENGSDYCFKNVKRYFLNDSVTFANLEGTLTARTKPANSKKSHLFKGKPEYASILRECGIDVCNLANNHAKDFGSKGFADTKAALKAQNITYCDFSKNTYRTIEKNGISVKVGFIGFQTPVSISGMRSKVRALKKRCDLAVVSFHWCDTKEWTAKNYASDLKMAHAAIDAGADLVLGHHRHVPSGIELYKGKYIVYDLSNFVVGIKHKSLEGRPLTDSMIFQWNFLADETGYVIDRGIRVIPVTTTTSEETYPATDSYGDMGAPVNNWQPAVLVGNAAQEALNRIQVLSNIPLSME